jgi:transcriptional regulator GlxA family with amidase domain
MEFCATCAEHHLTPDVLAKIAGLPPGQFNRIFVQRTGMSPEEVQRLIKKFRREQKLALQIVGEALGSETLPK